MGFSKVFNSVKSGLNKGFQGKGGDAFKPIRGYVHGKNRDSQKRGGYAGGYGAITFKNIIDAHSSAEEIVETFGLDQEGCPYGNCYGRAYRQLYMEAMFEAILTGGHLWDLIDEDEVEELAYKKAIELAEQYIAGEIWIPFPIISWAYFEISDHNR